MKNLKGWNEFGIMPTTSYDAAGYDFYVPNLVNKKQKRLALKAFEKSYHKSVDELESIMNSLSLYASAKFESEVVDINIVNILHLFLCLDSQSIRNESGIDNQVDVFVSEYLVFDTNKKVPGIIPKPMDHVCINSGVHTALDDEEAGIFFNKSGMGTRGWDTRACVVDQDYAGLCHLSASYTKNAPYDGTFYCGDKFSQMVVLPIVRGECFEDIGVDKYNEVMKASKRGADAMGSTDIKH